MASSLRRTYERPLKTDIVAKVIIIDGILNPTISRAFNSPHNVPVINVIIIQIGIGILKLKHSAKIVALNATIPAIEISMLPEISNKITAKPKTPNSIYDCESARIFSRLK